MNLMLPEPDNAPAVSAEFPKVLSVSSPVLLDLLLPKLREPVSPSREAVSVPEVAIHENGYPVSHKDDVGCSGETMHVLPESIPAFVELRSHGAFDIGVPIPHARHAVLPLSW